jgi:hypothetical protein
MEDSEGNGGRSPLCEGCGGKDVAVGTLEDRRRSSSCPGRQAETQTISFAVGSNKAGT